MPLGIFLYQFLAIGVAIPVSGPDSRDQNRFCPRSYQHHAWCRLEMTGGWTTLKSTASQRLGLERHQALFFASIPCPPTLAHYFRIMGNSPQRVSTATLSSHNPWSAAPQSQRKETNCSIASATSTSSAPPSPPAPGIADGGGFQQGNGSCARASSGWLGPMCSRGPW